MTELKPITMIPAKWADVAVMFYSNERKLFAVNLLTTSMVENRLYVGFEFYAKPTLSELRTMKKAFEDTTEGFTVEAFVDSRDEVAKRFAEFFGLQQTASGWFGNLHYERVA